MLAVKNTFAAANLRHRPIRSAIRSVGDAAEAERFKSASLKNKRLSFFSGCTHIIPASNLASFFSPFSFPSLLPSPHPPRCLFSEGGRFTSHFCPLHSKLANQNVDLSPYGVETGSLCAVLGTSDDEAVLLIGLAACITAAPFIAELIGPITFLKFTHDFSLMSSCSQRLWQKNVFGFRTVWPHRACGFSHHVDRAPIIQLAFSCFFEGL